MRLVAVGFGVVLFVLSLPAFSRTDEPPVEASSPPSAPVPAGVGTSDKEPLDPKLVQLETIGALAAINAQHAFLLIGVVSDTHFKGVYEPRQVRSLMNGIVRQLETLSAMLRKLQKSKLTEEDNEYVEQVLALHAKLETQARALITFTEKRGPVEARAFERARQSALRDLERLFGTDNDPPADAPPEAKPAEPAPANPPEEKPERE